MSENVKITVKIEVLPARDANEYDLEKIDQIATYDIPLNMGGGAVGQMVQQIVGGMACAAYCECMSQHDKIAARQAQADAEEEEPFPF